MKYPSQWKIYLKNKKYIKTNKLLQKSLLQIIRFYQYSISPLIGPSCRFTPTCSQYTYDAILEFGVAKGAYLGIKRILKCNPFHKGGYDPVPCKKDECENT